jgi:hypothetical protein
VGTRRRLGGKMEILFNTLHIDVAVNFFQQCQLEITAIATAATRHSNGVTRQQRGVSTAAKQNDQTHIHFIFTPTIP